MINYSIAMRSVNANLQAINQAKSRINQAKKEGKTDQGNSCPEGDGGAGYFSDRSCADGTTTVS